MQQKRCILKGISSHIIKCNNKAANILPDYWMERDGSPELFDVHLNEVLVHFYIAAGKPNGEKYRGTARKLWQSTDILDSQFKCFDIIV